MQPNPVFADTPNCDVALAAAWPAALRVDALLTARGALTLRARRLLSRPVRVCGYVSAAAARGVFALTAHSTAACQICGALHDPGPALLFRARRGSAADELDPGAVLPHAAVCIDARLALRRGQAVLRDARLSPFPAPVTPLPAARRGGLRPGTPPRSSARAGRGVRTGIVTGEARRTGQGAAELILCNARVHTVCEALGTVEAVAIRAGRFQAVGSNADVSRHAGPGTEIVDLGGKTVIPGLIDSHLHQIMLAVNLPAVDLLPARDIADVQARIAERARDTPDGDWVVASSGWHESILREGRMPTRRELDAAAPGNPVMVPRGGHVVTANSAALSAAGVDAQTPDPAGGVIVRDPQTGRPTGVLLETAANLVRRVAPRLPAPAQLAEQLADAMQVLNSFGVVSVVDPSVDERISEVYKSLHRQGRMTVRSDLLYKARDLAETRKGIAYTLAQDSDEMLRFPGIKFMLDGGVEGARLREPYRLVPGEQPDADYRGLLLTPPGGREELLAAYRLVAEAGLQAQTHGVGDEAIDFIAGCYTEIAGEYRLADLNWCLMHVFLPSDAALQALREAGVLLTVQDHPVLLGHNQRRWWGEQRAAAAIPIRRLLDAGLLVGGGTDGPVVPVDPFLSMWWMVTRGTLNGDTLGPEHAISSAEALRLYTLNNARILGVDGDRGSIEPGKRADLAVLSQDILAVDPQRIRDTRALRTLLNGVTVYTAGDEAAGGPGG